MHLLVGIMAGYCDHIGLGWIYKGLFILKTKHDILFLFGDICNRLYDIHLDIL